MNTSPEPGPHDLEELVPAAVERTLALARTWPGWDGSFRTSEDGQRIYTPHKVVRRVADHLVDHLAEIEALLAGVPTMPDHWQASMVTLASDWAAFTEDDFNEAAQRLRRLARTYALRLRAAGPDEWDRPRDPNWSLRAIVEHVSSSWYAEQVGNLQDPVPDQQAPHQAVAAAHRQSRPAAGTPLSGAAEWIFGEWDRRARTLDVDGLLDLYTDDAILESPLVPRVLAQHGGVLRGKEQLRSFFEEGGRRRPNQLVRWHRDGTYSYDGHTLTWEYQRATPDGDQVDLAEVMEIRNARISRHRIYWGWFGTEMLIANAVQAATRDTSP
ncbi:MAG: nuclear transport factor 2 family protein [Streptosporangiaceae bacterium]